MGGWNRLLLGSRNKRIAIKTNILITLTAMIYTEFIGNGEQNKISPISE
jgi:hypothetical protein